MKKILVPLILAAAVTLPAGAQTIQLNGAGATFPAPIYTKWFSEYHKAHSNVQINYQAMAPAAESARSPSARSISARRTVP